MYVTNRYSLLQLFLGSSGEPVLSSKIKCAASVKGKKIEALEQLGLFYS